MPRHLGWQLKSGGLILLSILAVKTLPLPDRWLPVNDFSAYWVTSRLLLEGKNPYQPHAVLARQRAVGWCGTEPLIMWNPPWALPFVLPFGFLPYSEARVLWLWLSMIAVICCANRLWEMYAGPNSKQWLSWLVAFLFVPTLSVLALGQIGPLVLLGVVGFLFFEGKHRPVLAGICLTLVAIKPHLLYLFWITLLVWSVRAQQWRLILGGALATFAAATIPLLANPLLIEHYFQAPAQYPILHRATPTLGSILRLSFGVDHVELQFTPLLLGLAWLVIFWRRHRDSWSWARNIHPLLLVSMATVGYGWMYDQVVLLPAMVQLAAHCHRRRQIRETVFFWTAFVAANLVAFILRWVGWPDIYLVWMAPTWLFIYWLVWRPKRRPLSAEQTASIRPLLL